MKLCYKVCTSKCVDIEFQHIYDYIKSENPNASVEDIYWMFCNDVDYYIKLFMMLLIFMQQITNTE